MRKYTYFPWIAVALVIGVSLGWSKQSTENQNLIPLAEKFLNHLIQNETKDAIAMFDATMTKALPPKKLEKMWPMLQLQTGVFEKISASRLEKQEQKCLRELS